MSLDWSAVLGLAGVLVGAGVSYLATRQAAERTFDAAQLTITANTATAEQDRKDAAEREYRASKRVQYDNLASELADLNVALMDHSMKTHNLSDDEIQDSMLQIMGQANLINRRYSVFADEALRVALRFTSSIAAFVAAPINGKDRGTYAALSRSNGKFVWGSSRGLGREHKIMTASANTTIVRGCVDWCIAHISHEMGYNKNLPQSMIFEFEQ